MAPILARAAPSKQSITASHEATSKPSNKNAKMEDKRRHLSKLRSIVPPSATTLHLTQLLDAGPPKAKKKARPDAKRLKEPIIAVGTASTLALSRATDIFGTVQDCLGGIRETVPIKKTATLSKNDLVNDKHQMKPRKSFFPHSNIALTNGNKRSSSDNQVNANEASQKAIIDNDPTVAEHESTNSMKAAPFMNLNDNSVVKNRMLPVESSARRASKPLLYFQEKRPAKKRLRISHRQATSLVPTDDAAAATEGSREPTGDNSQVVLPSPTCRVERTELFAVAAVQDRSALPYTVSTVSTNAAPSKMPTSLNAASQSTPRPNGMGTVALANTTKKQQQKGNFVRLNLRNKAGSCLGARNVKAKSKAKLQWEQRKKDRMDLYKAEHGGADEKGMNQLFSVSGAAFTSAGVDPVDDFVDGVFAPDNAANGDDAMKNAESNQRKHSPTIPTCSGHQQPCKLLTVKKSGPYKGRKFYACPCPRGEQCNHFLWADDTLQAAKDALLKNKSLSGFIARHVASYMTQIKCLTVPELRDVLKGHNLDSTGNKQQLLMRLSVWVRDEVASGTEEMGITKDDDESPLKPNQNERVPALQAKEMGDDDDDNSFTNCDDDDSSASSDEELELIGAKSEDVGVFLSNSRVQLSREESCKQMSQDQVERSQRRGPESRSADAILNRVTTDGDISYNDEGCGVYQEGESHCGLPTIKSTLRQLFGYSKFRDGQEWAISRCLNKQRSLLVAPTGFGKSLCFTLPAALMKGVCIVVSPLLSLIQDQIRLLPARLPAVTLSGPMSTASMAATLDDIIRGRIKLLFVSPERLTSASFRRLFRPRWNQDTNMYERYFPEVSLFCVDEAHCLSQWAHNFRPSYLRLRSIIDLIEPQSILAITATAGPRVVDDICRTLKIDNGSPVLQQFAEKLATHVRCGVRISKTDRNNIDVTCLFLDTHEQRLSKLLKILGRGDLTKDPKRSTKARDVDGCLAIGSVIVYVWRQRDAEVVAENIQATGEIFGGAVVYHGGMDSTSRMKAQSKFMRGKVRICVATIAFGLGINKADVAGVIHLYLSSSPEHYIQEIGRAGRDGRPAMAIALLLKDEVIVRHSLAHSDLISKSQVRALISFLRQHVKNSLAMLPQDRSQVQPVSASFPLSISVLGCDCKAETAETILCLLEQRDDKEPLLFIEGFSYDKATIASKRCRLEKLAEREPIARAILHCAEIVEPPAGEVTQTEKLLDCFESRTPRLVEHTFGSYTFSIAQCSNCLGESAEPRHVFAALRRLEANGEIELVLDTSPRDRVLSLRLTNEGMHYFKADNYDTIDELINETMDRFVSTIRACASKVIDVNHIMRCVSVAGRSKIEDSACEKSASLAMFQLLIGQYFEAEGQGKMLARDVAHLPDFNTAISFRELLADSQAVLSHLKDIHKGMPGTKLLSIGDPTVSDYTAMIIAKFLHGIAPACMPANLLWGHHLFGKMQRFQFSVLHDAVGRLFELDGK